MDTTNHNQLLSLESVAKLCDVSKRTVYRWLNHDNLPVYRLPGVGIRKILRISLDDLETWLHRHRHDPEVEKAHQQVMVLEGMRFMKFDQPRRQTFGRKDGKPKIG